ncbi:Tex family protein [Aerococcus suis]
MTSLNKELIDQISQQLTYSTKQLTTVLNLLEEGNTVPFIARYRKEMTGSLDELQIREIQETYAYTNNLEERKETVLNAIAEQDKLTPELEKDIKSATVMQRVEDLYAPYKQKRRTKATIAKENGLEPLATWLFSGPKTGNVKKEAANYINDDIANVNEALAGAHEIMCEWLADDASNREWLRQYLYQNGKLETSKRAKAEDDKGIYKIYYDFSLPMKQLKPYQVLAINRGVKQKVLTTKVQYDEFDVLTHFVNRYIEGHPISVKQIQDAIQDSLNRFLIPAASRDIHSELTEEAEAHAIANFADNLGHLLMQPPVKGKTVLGLDPAFRTGCKLAVVDETGQVLTKTVIYPHQPVNKVDQAKTIVRDLVNEFSIDLVAIGNGTASRESERFIADLIQEDQMDLAYSIVNESGASVYSASAIAREEFPDYNVEERSAVSIARRLQDPLAELVKIEPKAIGVGQYQHDVSQKQLSNRLDFTVETVVNRVGVDINTASAPLLEHIAGLTKTVAKNIVLYRNENGQFTSRDQLKKVKQMGPKKYEQSAGFLRVPKGDNILDNTGIHPENYEFVKQLLNDLEINISDVNSEENIATLKQLNHSEVAQKYGVGEETVSDILSSLMTPGRDPRDEVASPVLRSDVLAISDLKEGMQLQGTVRNVVDFGAFVDIGVKQDGLVHISRMSRKFVKNPLDIVSVGDIIDVWVQEVDKERGRIGLSMIPLGE